MVKSNLITDFFTTLPISGELMMGMGVGDKLIKPSSRPKSGYFLQEKWKESNFQALLNKNKVYLEMPSVQNTGITDICTLCYSHGLNLYIEHFYL